MRYDLNQISKRAEMLYIITCDDDVDEIVKRNPDKFDRNSVSVYGTEKPVIELLVPNIVMSNQRKSMYICETRDRQFLQKLTSVCRTYTYHGIRSKWPETVCDQRV
jgi:hypothetical protein